MPDTKPAGGVIGLDTPPPGQLTCRWPPHDCLGGAQGRLNLALDSGPPALLDCIGTGGAAHGWVASHGGLAARLEGPGHAKRCPARGLPRLFTQVAVLLST